MPTPWRNPRTLLIWVLAALAETAAATPWNMLLFAVNDVPDWPSALPGAWVLLLAFAGAAVWEFGAPSAGRGKGSGRVLAMGFGVALIYLIAWGSMPSAFRAGGLLSPNIAMAVLPAAAYLWYSGAETAAAGLDYGRAYTRFSRQTGVLLLGLLLLIIAGFARDSRIQVGLYWSVLLLFGSGMTLLLLTRERALRRDQASLGESTAGESGVSPWLSGMVGTLLLITLAVSRFLSVERLNHLLARTGDLLSAPLDWLVQVAMLIIIRWAAIIFFLFNLLRGLIPAPRRPRQDGQEFQPSDPFFSPEMLEDRALVDWTGYLKAGIIVVILLTIALLLYRLASRTSGAEGEADEERINLGFWRGLLEDLRGLLKPRRTASSLAETVAEAEPEDDPADPRSLFRRLQRWGFTIGRPRRTGETPLAFAAALSARQPESAEAPARVAELYNQYRYGTNPPDPEAVKAASETLSRATERS